MDSIEEMVDSKPRKLESKKDLDSLKQGDEVRVRYVDTSCFEMNYNHSVYIFAGRLGNQIEFIQKRKTGLPREDITSQILDRNKIDISEGEIKIKKESIIKSYIYRSENPGYLLVSSLLREAIS